MADAKKIGDAAASALRAAMSVVGPLALNDRENIQSAMNVLQQSLRPYDSHAQTLSSSVPTAGERKEDLNNWIKKRYPQGKGYTDKRYKMMFMRTMYRVPFMLRNRDKEKHKIIASSLEALTAFKLIYNLVLANTKQLLRVSGGLAEETQDLQPEEFDPEQSGVTQELERELNPTPATDKHQKQTETNVKRRTKRVQQTGKAQSNEEYQRMLAKYSQVLENARTAVSRYAKDLQKNLSVSDARTFRYITQSARAANDLAKAFDVAANNAKGEMVPGSFIAGKSFAAFLAELGKAVTDSAATNKQERGRARKRQKAYDKYLSTTTVSKPQEG